MPRSPSTAGATIAAPTADHEPAARGGAWVKECALIGRRFHWRAGSHWRHNAVNAGFLVVHLLLAAAAIRAVVGAPWFIGVPLGGLALGLIFFLLLAIGVHEASHGMFFVAADRDRRHALNRAVGWVLAVPFGIHYGHHLVDQVPWYRLRAFHRALGERVPSSPRRVLFRSDPLRVLAGLEARA